MSAHEDDAGKVCDRCGQTYDIHEWVNPDCSGDEPNQAEAEHRLLDTLIPREVAEKALALYSDYLIRTNDRVYAMQQAIILASEELGLHRHWRGSE